MDLATKQVTHAAAAATALVVAFAYALLLAPGMANAAPASLLGLFQLPAPNACHSNADAPNQGNSACTPVTGIERPAKTIVSPDGKNVYVVGLVGTTSGSIAQFSRSTTPGPTFGALTQLPNPNDCLSLDVDNNSAADNPSCSIIPQSLADQIHDIEISPDGKHVYAAAGDGNLDADADDGLLVFTRDTNPGPNFGSLTYSACYFQGPPGICTSGNGLMGTSGLAISPGGEQVYVIANSPAPGSVAVYDRNASTGLLAFSQCKVETTGSLPGCAADGHAIDTPVDVAVSGDGASVYVASGASDSVAVFNRNQAPGPAFGEITQVASPGGCISETGIDHASGTPNFCADGRAMTTTNGLTASPDGKNVYVTSGVVNDAIVVLTRSITPGPTFGTLSQPAGTAGCISWDSDGPSGPAAPTTPSCASGFGIRTANSVIVSPDGKSVTATGASGAGGGVAVFSRDDSSGALTQLPGSDGCLDTVAFTSICVDEVAQGSSQFLSQSPDGRSVYHSDHAQRAVMTLVRGVSAPVCSGAAAESIGQTVAISLTCTDADGDLISRAIASAPSGGTLGAIDPATGTVAYTPRVGFSGTDSFTFTGADWSGASAPATVTVGVGLGISKLSLKPRSFKPGKRGGTKISITVNIAANVNYTIARQIAGRRTGSKCKAGAKTGKRCTALRKVGSFTRKARAGNSSFKFTGELRRRALRPGKYRITAVATDADGKRSAARSVSFSVK